MCILRKEGKATGESSSQNQPSEACSVSRNAPALESQTQCLCQALARYSPEGTQTWSQHRSSRTQQLEALVNSPPCWGRSKKVIPMNATITLLKAGHGSHMTIKGVSWHFIFDGQHITVSFQLYQNLVIRSHCEDPSCHIVKVHFEKQ